MVPQPDHTVTVSKHKSSRGTNRRKYNGLELMKLWVQAGGKKSEALLAAAIALAESGGDSGAVNTANSDGSVDRGLWQINSVHGYNPTSLMDARTNAQIAVKIRNGSGWTAWSTFKNGAYKAKMKDAAKSVVQGPDEHPLSDAAGAVTDAAGDVAGAVTDAVEWTAELGNVLKTVQSEDFWKRVLMFALALAALGLGVSMLGREFAAPIANAIPKVPL